MVDIIHIDFNAPIHLINECFDHIPLSIHIAVGNLSQPSKDLLSTVM